MSSFESNEFIYIMYVYYWLVFLNKKWRDTEDELQFFIKHESKDSERNHDESILNAVESTLIAL